MSSDRANSAQNRPYKPAPATNRTINRAPLTPRLATSAKTATPPTTTARTPVLRSERSNVTPKIKQPQDGTPVASTAGNGNVTPRSSARRSRAFDSPNTTPSQADDSPNSVRPRSMFVPTNTATEWNNATPTLGSNGARLRSDRLSTPKSALGEAGSSKGYTPASSISMQADSYTAPPVHIDSRFFHASELPKVEPTPKRPEPKTSPAFFYADGQQAEKPDASTRATSPVLSAVSDKGMSASWTRSFQDAQATLNPPKSPTLLSPALSALSSVSPFFASATQASNHKPRSPSPSKESIHLSYRKGASQIFGSRPSPLPSNARSSHEPPDRRANAVRNPVSHKKSPSLSSIDSITSQPSRRRSKTGVDAQGSSPLVQESGAINGTRLSSHGTSPLPSIDTSLEPPITGAEGALSPTKSVSEVAADARRERKVLDLEISNSSLLAINASLEREVRRQKTELKRFRRLSRAGRLSSIALDRSNGFDADNLSTLDEEVDVNSDGDFSGFGPPSGFTDLYDDYSDEDDDEDRSSLASGEPMSPGSREQAKSDRLAKDERRLKVDLEKHRELLVQSQMMNQSLKRCMFSTEEMIKDGKKALDYKVRVSDVKLGGRILSAHDEDQEDDDLFREEIEVEDEFETSFASAGAESQSAEDDAKGFLDIWGDVGGRKTYDEQLDARFSLGNSDGGADRDSGVELDKPAHYSQGVVTPATARMDLER